jgi:hypothetical protein
VRKAIRRAGGTPPASVSNRTAQFGPLILITQTAARPKPEAAAKMVSSGYAAMALNPLVPRPGWRRAERR